MATYLGWDTSRSLLLSYDVLAREFRRVNDSVQNRAALKDLSLIGGHKADKDQDKECEENKEQVRQDQWHNLNHVFALLSLNASILEGIIRAILSEIVSHDVRDGIKKGQAVGQSNFSRMEILLQRFQSNIEGKGGWAAIKGDFFDYTGINLDDTSSVAIRKGVAALFDLRNTISHGTSFVVPTAVIPKELKDIYPYKWQAKLKLTNEYLKNVFGKKDFFENLAVYEVPGHFMKVTQDYLQAVLECLDFKPAKPAPTIKMLMDYKFGFKSW